jgi:hypothetical protein
MGKRPTPPTLAPGPSGDRRRGFPRPPLFGPLLAEAGWTPEGVAPEHASHEGWLRAAGLVEDRREVLRRRSSSRD